MQILGRYIKPQAQEEGILWLLVLSFFSSPDVLCGSYGGAVETRVQGGALPIDLTQSAVWAGEGHDFVQHSDS